MQNTIRAISYARLSVKRGGESLAIGRQHEDCQKLIEQNGWKLVGSISDDGKSAWHEGGKRPGYEALCEAIRRREVDVVVVYEVDRLARRLRGLLDLIDLLNTYDVTVHTVKSGVMRLDSPKDIAFAQMAGVIAESYVSEARYNNLRMRRQMAENGRRHVTARPYGWEAGGLKVRESEAAVVREITARIIDGETGSRIARDLNRRKIATVKGAEWTGIGVKKTALRAANAGLREHHGNIYDGTWEPIVSRQEWERVQHVLSAPTTAWKRGKGRKYPFTGFVVCGSCGRALSVGTGRSNSGHTAYRCDMKKSHQAEATGCGGVQRAQIPVDYLIKEALIVRLDGGALHKAISALHDDEGALVNLLEQAARQRERIDSLVEDYASGLLTRQQLAKAKSVAEARLREIEQEASLHSGTGMLRNIDLSRSIRETVESADLYWLRDVAEILIERVEVKPLPKKGWKLEHVVIDGKRYRFSPEYVEIFWRV